MIIKTGKNLSNITLGQMSLNFEWYTTRYKFAKRFNQNLKILNETIFTSSAHRHSEWN